MDSRPEYGVGRLPQDADGFYETQAAIAATVVEERLVASGRLVPCPNCGSLTYPENFMAASRGRACPECYDDLSD